MRTFSCLRHLPALSAATLLVLSACADSSAEGGSEDGASSSEGDGDGDGDATTAPTTDPSGDGDGDATTNPTTSGDGDGDDPTTSGDGDGDDPPPAPSLCEDFELPARPGAQWIVSPAGPGQVELDGQTMSLRQAVNAAAEGDTILLADGTYTFFEAGDNDYTGVYITTPNITLRSQSGDPSAVIIDSAYLRHGGGSAPITIAAPGVVVADITVQRSIYHLIHLWADGDDAIIHNVDMIDGGQQFVKASPGNDAVVDGVEVSCSRFVMTQAGRANVWGYGPQDGNTACYTGGIDTHDSTNWHVHDSYFEGIYCDDTPHPAHGQANDMYTGGLAEHAIHMWDSAPGSGHLVERNRIVNCARGIGIGLVAEVHGSRVLNNMVFSEHAGSGEHDVGIIVERAIDTLVAHNSVYFSHPQAYASGIEYRWDSSANLELHGNITNRMIRARDGAVAELTDNLESAEGAWFIDPPTGDLHLADCNAPGSAGLHPEVGFDVDGEVRGDPTAPGADVCN